MVAKFRKRLAVSKQAAQKFEVEIFKLLELNGLEIRKQYRIKISNRFAALENISDSEDINRAWENLKRISKSQLKRV